MKVFFGLFSGQHDKNYKEPKISGNFEVHFYFNMVEYIIYDAMTIFFL